MPPPLTFADAGGSYNSIMKAILLLMMLAVPCFSQWIKQNVITNAAFRGLSVVNEKVVWASGTGGTVIRTIDGGKTWDVMTVPGAEKLDFRDIDAFDANTAYILSIGNGESSRIYKTTDGGKNWGLQFKNTNEKAFFDAIACSRSACMAVSDPVDGRFLIIVQRGDEWVVDEKHWGILPPTLPGEAAFAASGTCLIASPSGRDFFIVSGGSAARVFHGRLGIEGGITWSVSSTPFIKGNAGSGIFSIATWGGNAIIVGGDYEKPNEAINNLAWTKDLSFGTWSMGSGLSGFRSGVAYIDKDTIVAVGTNGTDRSNDGGKTWKKIGGENLNAVAANGTNATWAVGPEGLVVKMK